MNHILIAILAFIVTVGIGVPGAIADTERAPTLFEEETVKKVEEVYVCPMHPEIRTLEVGLCPICGMALVPEVATEEDQLLIWKEEGAVDAMQEHKHHDESIVVKEEELVPESGKVGETLYICPMHPQIHKDSPGSCSICGMDLTPVHKGHEKLPASEVPGFASIKVDPQQQWLIGVKTAPVERKNLVRHLRTVGRVAYDPGLYVAQKEYLEALKTGRYGNARSFVEAARLKLTLLGMSPEEIVALEAEGRVDESLFLTRSTGRAWIYSAIYESERPLLQKGLVVEVRTVGHPQMKYVGLIDSITPVVNPQDRTITVRSAVDDPIGLLMADMFVDVYIVIPLGEALAVPKSSVLQTGLRNIVLVAQGDGIFQPREVILGNQSDDEYQVISGLALGEVVVSSANFLIDSESQLKSAFQSASGGQMHDH